MAAIWEFDIFKMATKIAAIYHSAGNASISIKLSRIIPVVILSRFELLESGSDDLPVSIC